MKTFDRILKLAHSVISSSMEDFLKTNGDKIVTNPDTQNRVKIKSLKGPKGQKLLQDLYHKWKGQTKTKPVKVSGSKLKKEVEKHLFGIEYSQQEVSNMIGVDIDGANIEIEYESEDQPLLNIEIKHKDYKMSRYFYRDKDALIVYNDSFEIKKTGTGLGTKMFSQQIESCKKLGVSKFKTRAIKTSTFNGYYTWARLGYDAKIPDRSKLSDILKSCKMISDLMKTPDGRAWWKENGSTVNMSFDLSDDSLSMRVFRSYLEEKKHMES
jgi:hypothetical protein